MSEDTIFTKIIKGEIPSVKLYEDEVCIAILDKFPNCEGQTLIIPKQQVDYAFDLDDQTYSHLLSVSKKITEALDQALKPLRTCLVIEGFEIPHAHIKLYPVKEAHLLVSGGKEWSNEDLEKVALKIRKFI